MNQPNNIKKSENEKNVIPVETDASASAGKKKSGYFTIPKRLPRFCIGVYILTAISAFLYFLFTESEPFADWFNRTIGAVGRRILAWLTAWIPFSVGEMLLLSLPLLVIILIAVAVRHYSESRHDALVYAGILLSGICIVGILFVWNFAPGYYGSTLDRKLELDRQKVSTRELEQTATILADNVNLLTDKVFFGADGASVMPYSLDEMNSRLMSAYDRAEEKYGFIDSFYSKIKPVMLSEPMSYTHITGVYSFFTGEANLNVNFPDYTLPYTAAHELAHQRGIAREDEANFVAFLICLESDDPYIRYSGYLNLFEYVGSSLNRADREAYRTVYASLYDEVKGEEVAYNLFYEKYRENKAAEISQKVNNVYLQSQGTPEGSRSYGMVVDLAVAYYRQYFN